MTAYSIVWSIDVDEESPEKAARAAQEIQQDPDSTAMVFEITEVKTGTKHTVDLSEGEEEDEPSCRNLARSELRAIGGGDPYI